MKWVELAHDFNSPLMRHMIWTKSFFRYYKEHGLPIPKWGIRSEKNNISYICVPETWGSAHVAFAKKLREDIFVLRRLINYTNLVAEEKCDFTRQVFESDLSRKRSDELLGYLTKSAEMQSRIYALGTALPLLDFQDWSFIETNLKEYLKSKTDRAEEYFHTLTVPSEDSFSIDEQKDMLRMLDKHKSKRLWRILDDNNASVALEKVKEEFPRFYNDLKAHTKKYAWVYYVYSGPLFKEEDFLELIKSHLDSDPKEKLIEIEEEKARLIAEKERIIAELKPDEFNEELMRISGTVIWAKPRRKDYQSLTYYHLIEGLYKEIARRLGVSRNQILSAPFHWIEKGLRTGKIDVNKLNQIYDFHIAIPKGDKVEILYGDAARRFAKNIECPKEDFDEVDEIKGSVACPGNAEGIVRIINIPADMGKMEKGDILVSAATTPSIVSAMHKASAIITDEGGITCHAAIVSREMQTPCVIGTKFATKILKDGDRVSVDAYSGLVRRIKN